jgi:trk system potassium uptake protein TrkA
VIAGAGAWGLEVAHGLRGHELVLVDRDPDVVRATTGRWTLARGDACEPDVLERLDLRRADMVVAATGDDEDNLIISLLAKRLGAVPTVVARVNDARNAWLFTADWGVDEATTNAAAAAAAAAALL